MKRYAFLLIAAVLCQHFVIAPRVRSQEPKPAPAVILPEVQQPAPAPLPATATVKLDAGVWYVVRSKEPCMVLASPDGVLTVTREEGPLKVRGVFYGGSGKPETKTFTEKYIWFVEAAQTATCELLIIPQSAKDESGVVRRTIDANVGPRPPPEPPGPGPGPAPIPVAGFRVLIMYDKDTLTADQQGIVFGADVRKYLDTKCIVGADGKTPDRRIYPAGVDASGEAQWIRDVIQRHPGQRSWMVISDGKTGYDGPIPANAADALALLKKYGG